jgi:hypothetical protein
LKLQTSMHCEKYPKLSALQNTINGYHDNNNNPYNNHVKAKADTAADIKEIVDLYVRWEGRNTRFSDNDVTRD